MTITDVLSQFNFQPIGESNGKIKEVKAILSNTKPNPLGLFVAEGVWLAGMCERFSTPVDSVIVCPEHIRTPEAINLVNAVAQRAQGLYTVSAKTFEKISEKGQPDGVLLLAKLPRPDISQFKPQKKSVILVIDGVEIPGNVGTMLRMADGAGVNAVFMCNRKARMTHPKLIKSSQGAVLTVPVFEFTSVKDCNIWLNEHGFTVYLADTRAELFYYEEPFGGNTAIIVGSERYGISREWYDYPHKLIAIPMQGKCDSLNVGVAATVLCYEACIKNKAKGAVDRGI
ncbi:MAG: hypothetical protein LUI60_01500 [Clostridia bacterium]|nr:hypothetical protein [Clostridia bacterium]